MGHLDIKKRDFAQTLARGLTCLEVLAGMTSPASCSEIAAAMRVSRAAARRILLTLQSLGYVLEARGLYASAPKVLSLGRSVLRRGSVWESVAPMVVAVADQLNEPCSISVLDGLEIVFVCRDATRRIYSSRLGIGDRLPAHCSAAGKVLLAALPDAELKARLRKVKLKSQGPASLSDPVLLRAALARIRASDFATTADEMEDGLVAVAVPLRERKGQVIGAMSVASHRSRMTVTELKKRALPVLQRTAGSVENVLRDFQDRNLAVF
jgi:IclR family pca regulon transcriptional regulator